MNPLAGLDDVVLVGDVDEILHFQCTHEALVQDSFVGDLATDAPGTRESLISRMGWNTPDYGMVLQ